jgi:hypothetical protein
VTELPSLSNMMQFYPRLHEKKLLDAKVTGKVELIFQKVDEFIIKLNGGSLTLDVLVMMKEPSRVDRLLTLLESHPEVANSDKKLALKRLIIIRMLEMDEYHQAKEDLRKFKSKFEQVQME